MKRTLFLALLALGPVGAAGQTLNDVDQLIRDGRIQEARETLLAWSDATRRPDRVDRQRALWFRGVLNLDPAQAASAFRRLVLEYPGGPFTDLALHRLGMSAALRGDLRAAESSFSVLARDYPGSPMRREARDWLARNRTALDSLSAQEDVAPSRPAERVDDRSARSQGGFAAQLGAFSSRDRADAVAQAVREAGFQPRVVRIEGSDFFRVRVGRFEDPEAARAVVERLRQAGFEAGLAADADRERRVG